MLALPALSLDFHRRRVPEFSKIRLTDRNNPGKGFKRADRPEQGGSVPAVWSPVLVLAFMMALDPLRLAVLLLLIARPRPVQSLLAYWIGAMTASVPGGTATAARLGFGSPSANPDRDDRCDWGRNDVLRHGHHPNWWLSLDPWINRRVCAC